jgi:hypothetical protein
VVALWRRHHEVQLAENLRTRTQALLTLAERM